MEHLEAQFCVVGSGISGLTAAYRLRKAGASVIVLEAGERIGGRIHSAQLSDKTWFEIGAEWVSDESLNPSLRTLMRDLAKDAPTSFPIVEQYVKGENAFVDFGGTHHYYDAHSGGLPPIGDKAQVQIRKAFAALSYMSLAIDPAARWLRHDFDPSLSCGVKSTDDADRMTLYSWLEINFTEPAAKACVAAMYRGTMGIDPEAISLLHIVFFLKTFGSDPFNVLGAGPGQMQHLRLPQGVERISDAAVNFIDIGSIHTKEPVRDIQQFDDYAIVRSENVSVKAGHVIVATSTAAVNLIRFAPPLPPDRAQLQQRMGIGSFWKVWLAYDKPFWRFKDLPDGTIGLSGALICIKEDAFVATTLDSSFSDDGPGLLTCFIDAGRARAFANLSPVDREKAILAEMVRAFGEDAATLSPTLTFPEVKPQYLVPSAYFEWNWSLPEFIRGDYAAAPGPGVYTAEGFGPAIHQPIGRVHWAGSDGGLQCYGAMEGAVSSGERAVAEILNQGKVQK